MAESKGLQRAPKGGIRLRGKTYRGGQVLPKRYGRDVPKGERSTDPARGIEHAAPNFGRYTMPHILSFSAIATSAAKVYRNPDEAIKHSRENALIMRRDCSVMECLEARQRGTALLNWHLEPEDPQSQDQKSLCDELTKIIAAIPRFTEYRRNLLEAIWYGKYGVEHNYALDFHTGKKQTVVSDWIPRNGDKLVFRFDDGSGQYDENQVGIRVVGHYNLGDKIAGNRKIEPTESGMAYFFEPWERSRFAIHKHMIEDAPFEDYLSAGSIHGIGIRSRIYWTWVQKQECLAMLMEYLERTAQGIWVYYYPSGNPVGGKCNESRTYPISSKTAENSLKTACRDQSQRCGYQGGCGSLQAIRAPGDSEHRNSPRNAGRVALGVRSGKVRLSNELTGTVQPLDNSKCDTVSRLLTPLHQKRWVF